MRQHLLKKNTSQELLEKSHKILIGKSSAISLWIAAEILLKFLQEFQQQLPYGFLQEFLWGFLQGSLRTMFKGFFLAITEVNPGILLEIQQFSQEVLQELSWDDSNNCSRKFSKKSSNGYFQITTLRKKNDPDARISGKAWRSIFFG